MIIPHLRIKHNISFKFTLFLFIFPQILKHDRLGLCTRVVPKLVFTLCGRTCNAICQNSDEVHVFCSSLSFQQVPVDIYTLNRFQVTARFVKIVAHTPPKNERNKNSHIKKWERRSMFRSMGSIRGKVSALMVL